MKLIVFFAVLVSGALQLTLSAQERLKDPLKYPTFSKNNPRAVWLAEPNGDRRMELLDQFVFWDRKGKEWAAPAKYQVDGASIPRALWTLVGSPYTGCYRRASIVHDKACDEAGKDATKRRAADRMFYEACREGNCSVAYSTVLYIGVRIGALKNRIPGWRDATETVEPWRTVLSSEEQRIQADFRLIAQRVLSRFESDDAAHVERLTDQAIEEITGFSVR